MGRSRRDFMNGVLLGARDLVSEPHTLVCVFLRGGADTLSILVPCGDDGYYRLRPTLGIPPPSPTAEVPDRAIRLDEFYGLHPGMRPLVPAFHEGRLAFIQGVGSDNPTGSHFEAQDQMERGESYGRSVGSGWLSRYLQSRHGGRPTPLSAVALQPTLPESLRGAPAASAIESLDDLQVQGFDGDPGEIIRTLGALYESDQGLLQRAGRSTLELLQRIRALQAVEYVPDPSADYPSGPFGNRLREIARLVKAGVGLEVACVDLGGWDTHFFQGTTGGHHARLVDELARGLAAFDTDLASHRRRATTLVMTEFGRRAGENASLGTDHGRGFAMMALGGRIRGGRVLGDWPGFTEGDEEGSPGPGGLGIRIDYRSVLSEVLREILGLTSTQAVFPDFHPQPLSLTVGSGTHNVTIG